MDVAVDMREARALVRDKRLWPLILKACFCDPSRKPFFHTFPKDDGSRLALLDAATRKSVAKWLEALARADELKGVVDGEKVRVLKDELEGAYPECMKFLPYFAKWKLPAAEGERLLATAMRNAPIQLVEAEPLEGGQVPLEAVWKLLKLKFPEAYEICCS